jgi:hypothetical protein
MGRRLIDLMLMSMLLVLASCNAPIDEADLNAAVAATMEAAEVGGDTKSPDSPVGNPPGDEAPAPLTPAEPSSPVTPDVLTIAYLNGDDVWFYQEGGSPVQQTTSENAIELVLSTDGQLVVYLWYDNGTDDHELHAVQTASGVERVLLTQADLDSFYPLDGALHHIPYRFEFLPGTHTILMSTRKTFEGPGLVPNNDLWSIDGDSGLRTSLLTPGLGGDFYLSPSGTQLALTQSTTIGFANVDGSGRSPDHLTFPSVITYSEYQYYPIAVWAPDESAIVVVIPPEDPFVSDTAQVYRLPVSGGSTHLVDLTGFSFFRNQGRTPLISPDLSKVAFMRETAPNTFDLVVKPTDGSPESILASGNIAWQGWNPDSVRMVHGVSPSSYVLVGPGLTPTGLGFGTHLRWVDTDTFLYLDTLTTTHRFSLVNMPGGPIQIDEIVGQIFDFDFAE